MDTNLDIDEDGMMRHSHIHDRQQAATGDMAGSFDLSVSGGSRPVSPRPGFYTSWSNGSQTKGGELLKPLPPLREFFLSLFAIFPVTFS
jgi:hypothetical protein